jgi:glycosyltransferase involved in cell wall biosynthesis
MKAADAVLFYTDAEVASYRVRTQNGRRPVMALNNGLDLSMIRSLRVNYDASNRERAFLFIGRLTKKANIGLALTALARPEAEAIALHVLGDGEDKVRLMAMACDLGLGDRVIWHAGTVNEAHIAAIANRCRAFVYPGEVGLSLIHAMAYGLPSVVHDDPTRHMPEIAAFQAGKTGETFVCNDAACLARTMAKMIDNNANLTLYSANALATTQESYNTDDMAQRFVEMVRALSRV